MERIPGEALQQAELINSDMRSVMEGARQLGAAMARYATVRGLDARCVGHMHEVQGDPFFAERAETLAYNALPSTGTKDMWTRVYLQQPNEIFAGHVDPHPWNTDGGDSTTYSLGDN